MIRDMLGKTYDTQVCSIARTLEIVGERWSLLIVRDALFAGTTRYGEFQRRLDIATNVLRDRLDGFLEAGVMERQRSSEQPDAFEYLLTAKGRDLGPALIALTEWGDRWAAPEGPPIVYRHSACGSPIHEAVVCDSCGRVGDAAEVQARLGPGMPPERIAFVERLRASRSRGSTSTSA